MSAPVTRAAVIAAFAGLSLLASLSWAATAAAFVILGAVALAIPSHSPYFEHVARPAEVEANRLIGLAGFAFGIAVLAGAASIGSFGLPAIVFVMAVLIVAGGILGEAIAAKYADWELLHYGGLCGAGAVAGLLGYVLMAGGSASPDISIPAAIYLIGTGALATGLLNAVVDYGEDPVLILGVGGLLWIFGVIGVAVGTGYILGAIVLATVLGLAAYAWDVASIAGMLSGVLLGVIALVYGGIAWFVVLISFFVIGGLATKYRYTDKAVRGVAEGHEGARGSRNVLGNSLVAMVAVVAFAAAPQLRGVDETIFVLMFAGAVATALADTLSSEIGSLYDNPRLITTFERVRAGTHGGITEQGTVAGIAGATLIATLSILAFPSFGLATGLVVVIGGVVGMLSDSLFGATIEDLLIGNEGVNVLATLVGAIVVVGGGVAIGLVGG